MNTTNQNGGMDVSLREHSDSINYSSNNIKLNKCTPHEVETVLSKSPQLTVLNATLKKGDANILVDEECGDCCYEVMTLSLYNLDQLIHLTQLTIKGLGAIQLTNIPPLDELVNLKFLSLTSIRLTSKKICQSLNTITTDLKCLEIGDCDSLSEDFAEVLKRFKNLSSLRLENCYGKFNTLAPNVISSIKCLDKLKILQLINIDLDINIVDGLETCFHIRYLMIIPLCITPKTDIICHLIQKLRNMDSLNHLFWGLFQDFISVTPSFITTCCNEISDDNELSNKLKAANNIPYRRTRQSEKQGNMFPKLPVSTFKQLLKSFLNITNVEVVMTSIFSATGEQLPNYFYDLY